MHQLSFFLLHNDLVYIVSLLYHFFYLQLFFFQYVKHSHPIENITFEEIKKYLEEGSNLIREINTNFSIRKGPKGDYLFFKTIKMKKPQFYTLKDCIEDYKECDINILVKWVHDKYNIF